MSSHLRNKICSAPTMGYGSATTKEGSSDAGCNLTSLEGVRRKSSKTQKTANRIILCTCRVPERQTPRGEGGRKASGGMGSGHRGYGESLGGDGNVLELDTKIST